jgi:putative phosphoribosyl transferase
VRTAARRVESRQFPLPVRGVAVAGASAPLRALNRGARDLEIMIAEACAGDLEVDQVMQFEIRFDRVAIGAQRLSGELAVPAASAGLVMFAEGGAGSYAAGLSRQLAQVLHRHHLSTLLFDLWTDQESDDRRLMSDVPLLSGRVEQALEWTLQQPLMAGLRIGVFGACAGAAAALVAAAARPGHVAAVVSRSGRPDFAAYCLARVTAPTLLIVGARDRRALQASREALPLLGGPRRLEVVPDAGPSFSEPGALDGMAELAADWFERHLARPGPQ